MMNNMELNRQARTWIKRRKGPDEIIRIIPDLTNRGAVTRYKLYIAYGEGSDDLPDEKNPDYLGSILFDAQGYWIYDSEILTVTEQEQVAKFIMNYAEGV